MRQHKIQEWLAYWRTAGMVDVDQINAFDQVPLARKYCSCMRLGVFAGVTDLAIWRALVNMREPGRFAESRARDAA